MLGQSPQFAFKALFWTFNPKNGGGLRNLPFITWPVQDRTISAIKDSIDNRKDCLIDKSRDMGATWIVLGTFFWYWLFQSDCHFLCASRKEEYVDKRGDHKCLFAKLEYLHAHLPRWCQPQTERTHMHFANVMNGSVLDGESTNKDLGAGDRRLAVMLDEFARVDSADAQSISETLSDTTDCIIYNSTHTNMGHPYAKIRYGGKVKVVVMPWYEHPDRRVGLYRSPSYNQVEITDINWWRKKYGKVFDSYKVGESFAASDVEIEAILAGEPHSLFTADGKGNWRSPWYDAQVRRRSSRDVAQNIDMNPVGSGDAVFDLPDLQRMRTDYCRKPKYTGEIKYKIDNDNDRIIDYEFITDSLKKDQFQWWSSLYDGRPNQNHNYIVGCDISLGTGVSNSVASVYDCNTNSKVGSWVSAFVSPTNFAEQVVALCLWVGGARPDKPFLIWEENGPGTVFDRRIWQLGYQFIYYRKDEKKSYRPRQANHGWHSSADSKQVLIYLYREALSLTFRQDTDKRRFINPDELAIAEAEDYIFLSKSKIGPSSSQSEDGGAQATHGDRVIADALCCLARSDQTKAVITQPVEIPTKCFAARREAFEKNNQFSVEEKRWLD